jgi:hypothetical protein
MMTTTSTLRPSTLSNVTDHGSVTCPGGGMAMSARTVIPVRGGRSVALTVTMRVPAPVMSQGPVTAVAPDGVVVPALQRTVRESEGSTMRALASSIRISHPWATTFQSNVDCAAEDASPSVEANGPSGREAGLMTPGMV